MTGETRDFFVSYCKSDRDWATWIAWHLEANGYSTVIQEWDFGAGSNFVREMEDGLLKCRRLIAVLSSDYLKSSFATSEWSSYFADDPLGKYKKLLPVRVRECPVNGLLKNIVFVDLVGKDEASAKSELLSNLKGKRRKPTWKPRFPRAKDPVFPVESNLTGVFEEQVDFTMIITGTIRHDQRDLIEAIVEHLKKLSGDTSLTLLEVKKGSVIIRFRGKQSTLKFLEELNKEGKLSPELGYEVFKIHLEKRSSHEGKTLIDWTTLVAQIKAGDESGVEQLYKLFSRGIRYYLARQLGPQQLEDKVHDTFLIVVNAIRRGDLREPERLMGFVRTVVRRQVKTYIGQTVHNRREQTDLETGVTVADRKQNPEQEGIIRQKELMESALSALSARDREILIRVYLKEQPLEEICREMELTEEQFRLLRSRAKAKFGEIGKRKAKSWWAYTIGKLIAQNG